MRQVLHHVHPNFYHYINIIIIIFLKEAITSINITYELNKIWCDFFIKWWKRHSCV